ncbi:hypothetical protein [Stomatohabitans albus]|uniref:hypothetical protein n=1 Tax=Stomatohabitans albus TaxID=3110766 RepID=UPI00300D448C
MKQIFPLSQVVMTNVLRLIGLVGAFTATVGMVVGLWALNNVEAVLDDTLQLATTSLDALKSSSDLADSSLGSVRAGLEGIKGATQGMDGAFEKGETALVGIGDLVEKDISQSVRNLDGTMPGLIQVASTIDGAMAALNKSPLNLPYTDRRFSENLNNLQQSLVPIADNLEEQGKNIKDTAANLRESGENVVSLNAQVSALSETVSATEKLLDEYDATLEQGVVNLRQSQQQMKFVVWICRFFVVVLAISYAALMVVPLQLSALTRRSLERRHGRGSSANKDADDSASESKTNDKPDDTSGQRAVEDRRSTDATTEIDPKVVTAGASVADTTIDLDVGPEGNAPR